MNLLSTSTGRTVLFTVLYISEGAPIGYLWWALPTRLRSEGVDIELITQLMFMLALPWAFKALWSPVIDTLQSQRWPLRAWILSAQFIMGATLVPLFFLDSHVDLQLIVGFLLLHAFSAATQDAAIDALAINHVPLNERGHINAWMQVGMLTGRSVMGGGALILAAHLGNNVVLAFLIGIVYASSLLLLTAHESELHVYNTSPARDRFRDFGRRATSALKQRSTWWGLIFAAIGGAAYESVGAVAGPYMIDRGYSPETIGTFFAFAFVPAMIVGALAGGFLADRFGTRKAVASSLLFVVFIALSIAGTDAVFGTDRSERLLPLLSTLYLSIGVFTAGSYTLFMEITDKKLGATQFSAFMGATNGCESWSAFASGKLISIGGYPLAFFVMSGVSLVAVPIVRLLRKDTVVTGGGHGS